MSELSINWSTEIIRMAEKKGIKPENLILDCTISLKSRTSFWRGKKGVNFSESPFPNHKRNSASLSCL